MCHLALKALLKHGLSYPCCNTAGLTSPALNEEEVALSVRRILLLLTVAAVISVMMLIVSSGSLAQPQDTPPSKEELCTKTAGKAGFCK